MKNKTKKLAVIAAAVLVAVGFSAAMKSCVKSAEASIETHFGGNRFSKSLKIGSASKISHSKYFAVLHIKGVIQEANRDYNQKWLLETIENLENDSKNVGILLFVDSPGGTVYESDEAYLALVNYKNQTSRPIYAYFAHLAASGGYYVASAADYIFANRNALTGSIGVIFGQTVDATELMQKIGIKMRTFTAGRNKNMGGIDQPLTEEQEKIMQSIADDAYDQFVQIVAESRKLPIERIREIADGRIYTARQAKEVQLVDEIATLEDAKGLIEDDLGTSLEFEDFSYDYKESLSDIFSFVRSFFEPPQARLEYMAR